MKIKEAEEKYGIEMLVKMRKTGYLDGITVTMNKGGVDIPERDYEIAYKAAKGEYINPFEWD